MRILMADRDTDYLGPLLAAFVKETESPVGLEVITDTGYLETMLQKPQRIDLLIISEEMYSPQLDRHDIRQILLLQETGPQQIGQKSPERRPDLQQAGILRISRYARAEEIFLAAAAACPAIRPHGEAGGPKGQLILVTSLAGGSGKTTAALGLASALTAAYQKVLYLCSDFLQSFGCFFEDDRPVTERSVYMKLMGRRKGAFEAVQSQIRQEGFDYLPPLKGPLASLGFGEALFGDIARQAAQSGLYHYVILDTDARYDGDRARLMAEADYCLLITGSSRRERAALQCLLAAMDPSRSSRLICLSRRSSDLRKTSGAFESSAAHGQSPAVRGLASAVQGLASAVQGPSFAVQGPSFAAHRPSSVAHGLSPAVREASPAARGPSPAVPEMSPDNPDGELMDPEVLSLPGVAAAISYRNIEWIADYEAAARRKFAGIKSFEQLAEFLVRQQGIKSLH